MKVKAPYQISFFYVCAGVSLTSLQNLMLCFFNRLRAFAWQQYLTRLISCALHLFLLYTLFMASMPAFYLVTASFVKETRKAVTQLKKIK